MSHDSLSAELGLINEQLVDCRLCPRLVEWRERVANEKKKAFSNWDYWGRPVPLFGDPNATRLIVGLAPAAHGANRTGRMFTGDRSGDWLYRALFKAGVANQPTSLSVDDGLDLEGVLIAAVIHCAPPENKPLPAEILNCRRYLQPVIGGRNWKSVLCLGSLSWQNVLKTLGVKAKPGFGHLARHQVVDGPLVVASYHPSQQNTFTGKLTEEMFDSAIELFLNDDQPRIPRLSS